MHYYEEVSTQGCLLTFYKPSRDLKNIDRLTVTIRARLRRLDSTNCEHYRSR